MKQDLMHIFTSAYPPKVTDFYNASLAKQGNQWLIAGLENLRTLRTPQYLGIPSVTKSLGITGYTSKGKDYYLHLDEKKRKLLTLSKHPHNQVYLVDANARLLSYHDREYHFKGEMPISIHFNLSQECHIETDPKVNITHQGTIFTLSSPTVKELHVYAICR